MLDPATYRRRNLVLVGALGLALISCSGSGEERGPATPSQPIPATPVLTSLTLGAASVDLKVGRSRSLLATTLDQNSQPIAAVVAWTSSAPAIASVSSAGVISAIAPGVTTISARATAGAITLSGTVAATVSALSVTGVSVMPTAIALQPGGTSALTATVTGDSGVALAVSWGTSNALVATVTAAGVVTAIGSGAAQVCAVSVVDGTKQGCATVSVAAATVASVSVTPSSVSLLVGQNAALLATARDANGMALAGRAIAWSTSNVTIATVSATGSVSATGTGVATISAASEGRTGSAIVTVAEQSVTSVAVTPISSSIAVGQSVQLTAAVIGANSPPTTVTWSSTDPTKVTVNQGGLATGIASTGGTQVCATSAFDSSKRGCGTVVVTAAAFPSVATVTAPAFTFTPSRVDLAMGGTVTFAFTNIPHNVIFAAAAGAPANVPTTANANVSRQFNVVGTFNYECTLHNGMTATVVVH